MCQMSVFTWCVTTAFSVITWWVIGVVLYLRKKSLLKSVSVRKMVWLSFFTFVHLLVAAGVSVYIKPLPGFITPEADVFCAAFIIYPFFLGIIAPLLCYFACASGLSRKDWQSPVGQSPFELTILSLCGALFGLYYAVQCDLADGFSYLLIIVGVILAVTLNKQLRVVSWFDVTIFIVVITTVYNNSSDRLMGYGAIDSVYNVIIFAAVSLTLVWCWAKQKKKLAFACWAILFLPIIEIPKDVFRQIVGYSLIDWSTTEEKFLNTFISKVTPERIYAIEKERFTSAYDGQDVVWDVVTNYDESPMGGKYKFRKNFQDGGQSVFVIHFGGGGTMDDQLPNFAPISLYVLPRIFSLLK